MVGYLEMVYFLKEKRWWRGDYGNSKLIGVSIVLFIFKFSLLGNVE